MPASEPPTLARGIARSLRIYHRDPARTRRMDALNAQFAGAGALVFDIGAHVGDRVASFRRLGALVVAVEPQPAAMRALRLMFGRNAGVTLVPAAVGAATGSIQRLHINQYKAQALSILAEAEGYVDVGSMLEQHRRR